jgi:hypothetical protein
MAMQAAMEEAELKAKFAPKDQMTAYQKEMIEQRKLDRQARVGRAGKAEPSDVEKRRLGKQYIASQARNPALMAALQTTFSDDPEAAADPGLVAYDLMQSKMIPKLGAGKGYERPKPPKATKASSEEMSFDSLKAEVARRKSGGAGAAPAAAAASKSTGQSDVPIDQDLYKKDAEYRAWVDSQNK